MGELQAVLGGQTWSFTHARHVLCSMNYISGTFLLFPIGSPSGARDLRASPTDTLPGGVVSLILYSALTKLYCLGLPGLYSVLFGGF